VGSGSQGVGHGGLVKANHRPRPDPYPDEVDELFCDEDETLCTEERPCMCCWVDRMEALEPQ
jgi:hypothetical protein